MKIKHKRHIMLFKKLFTAMNIKHKRLCYRKLPSKKQPPNFIIKKAV